MGARAVPAPAEAQGPGYPLPRPGPPAGLGRAPLPRLRAARSPALPPLSPGPRDPVRPPARRDWSPAAQLGGRKRGPRFRQAHRKLAPGAAPAQCAAAVVRSCGQVSRCRGPGACPAAAGVAAP